MIPEQTILQQAERTAHRTLGGAAVVIVIDRDQLHQLNEVGTRVWDLCDGRSLAAIVDVIEKEFKVERARALADVRGFVDELVRLGAVTIAGSP